MTLAESILDEIALCRNLEVVTVAAKADSVTYRISLDMTLDRETCQKISNTARRSDRSVFSELRRRIRSALRFYLAADGDEPAPAGEMKSNSERMPSDSDRLFGAADRIAARHGE